VTTDELLAAIRKLRLPQSNPWVLAITFRRVP